MIGSNGQLEKGDIEKMISVEESMPCREWYARGGCVTTLVLLVFGSV
jgi:hypothetical protein